MSKFIELTEFNSYGNGQKFDVPIDKIQIIKPSSRGSTYVWIDGMKYEIEVLESRETIKRLIVAKKDE